MADSNTRQVVVIGGGPGGYAAAFLAADLGLKTTLINPDVNPGGVCLYRGCIPSKALLHVAKLIYESREAKEWGVQFAEPKIDLAGVRKFKEDTVNKLTGGVGQLTKLRKIDYIRGMAKFDDAHTLTVTKTDGGTDKVAFEHAILATGSKPIQIPKLTIDSPNLIDSSGALELKDIPKTMLVVGGGYIGLEMGTVYASLGTKVSVVEMTPGLLPGADRDLVAILQRRLGTIFDKIMLNTTVTKLEKKGDQIKVSFEGDAADPKEQVFDKVLMAVGRRPISQDLGLENTKAEIDQKGFVKVNEARQTAEPSIYAIGDVAGEPMLAHKASHEGRTAAEAISGKRVAFEPRAIPAVIFTDPEIAWCGLTEAEAKQQNLNINVAKFPWAASGRALTLGRTDGLTKMIFDAETEELLGVGIVGKDAGELISEGVLAMEMAATATDIGLTIHPHPTLSETLMEASEIFHGLATHVYRPKKD